MKIISYNKLVRDQIPDIIKSGGNTPITRVLEPAEFSKCLREKLYEEIQEFLLNDNIEELADIFEVMLAILDNNKISFEAFEKIRQEKALEKGEFRNRIFLVSVAE